MTDVVENGGGVEWGPAIEVHGDTIDLRPWGYAPGGYVFHCRDCPDDQTFEKLPIGDKRSSRCETHARLAMEVARQGEPDNWTPDERTVRDALDAMEQAFAQRFKHYAADASQIDAYRCGRDAVEALLPKPDPAAALVEGYMRSETSLDCPAGNLRGAHLDFARWLIDTGRIKP